MPVSQSKPHYTLHPLQSQALPFNDSIDIKHSIGQQKVQGLEQRKDDPAVFMVVSQDAN